MKRCILCLAIIQACLFVNAHASEEPQLHECPSNNKTFDIEKEGRLPFNTAGYTYELKFPIGTDAITIREEERQLRIAEEISTIIKAVSGDFKNAEKSVAEQLCASYTQKYKRSTIKITAVDENKKELAARTLIAGQEEHLYLSADLPISNIKQLTYDSSTNSVIEKEKPAAFYLGVNWQIGDVFEEYSGKEFYKKLSLKLMLKASSRPSESYGVGIGYSFDAVDVFAARLRTKDDSNVGVASLGYTDATVFGVSFNISKGLAWFKK